MIYGIWRCDGGDGVLRNVYVDIKYLFCGYGPGNWMNACTRKHVCGAYR
jgi:hypothetical protein